MNLPCWWAEVFQASRLLLAISLTEVWCFLQHSHPSHLQGMQSESKIDMSYYRSLLWSREMNKASFVSNSLHPRRNEVN